jgi:hypothetical protein
MDAKDGKFGLGHLLYEFIQSNEHIDTQEMKDAVATAEHLSRIIYDAGLNGTLQTMDANLMASALDIVRRLSSQTSTLGPETLLSDLSGIILKTLLPSSSEAMKLGNSGSGQSTANGISSPFSKYRNAKSNTSNGKNQNSRNEENISSKTSGVNEKVEFLYAASRDPRGISTWEIPPGKIPWETPNGRQERFGRHFLSKSC